MLEKMSNNIFMELKTKNHPNKDKNENLNKIFNHYNDNKEILSKVFKLDANELSKYINQKENQI